MSRRIGRILAFQALYSWEVGGIDIDELLDFSWIERDLNEDEDAEKDISKEQLVEDDGNPVPVNEVKYFLNDAQFKSFESLMPEKKSEVFAFARLLAKGAVENVEEIDSLVEKNLSENWSIDRINRAALSAMRIAIYEMLYQKGIAPTIVIDEAVEIVKDYGADDTHKFTNAVLDKIRKDLSE